MLLVEPGQIVRALLGEPAFAIPQQVLTQYGVKGAISFGDWVVAGLVLGFDLAGCKTSEYCAGASIAAPMRFRMSEY